MRKDAGRRALSVGVVIPTLNEEDLIERALESIPGGLACVVSDGGSVDRTVQVARDLGRTIVQGQAGRARQMNRGARALDTDVIVFLHADGRLPSEAEDEIRQVFTGADTVGGAFRLSIDSEETKLKWVAHVANVRSRFLKLPYGDQALFVRRDVFESVGGYPDIPIMEDVAFVRSIRRRGKLRLLSSTVKNTDRHWRHKGALATTLVNWAAITAYNLGTAPETIAPWYGRLRRSSGPAVGQSSSRAVGGLID